MLGFKNIINSSRRTLQRKINMFLRNARRRHPVNLTEGVSLDQSLLGGSFHQEDSGMDNTQATEIPQQILCVNECFVEGSLAGHLLQNLDCCKQMINKHLCNRQAVYKENPQLAVFDLATLLFFCPNPACNTALAHQGQATKDARAMSGHIRGPCLQFYQSEGESLLKWPEDLDPDTICKKLSNRRCHLRRSTKTRMHAYKEEFSASLTDQCQMCLIKGPLCGLQQHELQVVGGTAFMADSKVYKCSACLRREEKHMDMIHHFEAKVQGLSIARPEDTTALVAVEVEHPQTHGRRVVFVPSQLKGDLQTVEEKIPYNATVVVPKLPGALDQLLAECFDKAHDDKDSLRELTDFASRRPIVGSPTLELSVFSRMNQANIKMERISMYKSLTSTCKGEIETRNPNITSINKRNPHMYALTKKFCLVNTCPWSEGAQQKQSSERQARCSVNGVVKTKVVLTLLERLADLPLAFAPLFLNHAFAKLRALVKHIIGPSYSNYDLEVRFHASEWKIELVGFLYSEKYEDINSRIARKGEVMDEDIKDITKLSTLLPTVSINSDQLVHQYNLSQERAEVVAALARKHQTGHCFKLQPLSLIDITTVPVEINVTSNEFLLRRRAAQLGDYYNEDVATSAAISEICQTLMEEGFDRIAPGYGQTEWIEECLAAVGCNNPEMVKYHCLLMRTGAKGGWTLRREAGESKVEPYIPLLLEANEYRMSAETCYRVEQIEAENVGLDQGLKGLPFHFFENWKEVSVLQFLNGCMSKVPKLMAANSQMVIPVISQRNENLTWQKAPDGEEGDQRDEVFLTRGGEPYMRTSGDIRVLYELRPLVTDSMPLGQLACEYRILKPSRDEKAYDRAVGEIDPTTNVGPDSSTTIAGALNRAPTSMKLGNGKIMVKRSGAGAVPHLLYSGALNRYSNTLLFSPWRELESIRVDQEDIETAAQRQIRLKLFPQGVFQICQDEVDGDEDE